MTSQFTRALMSVLDEGWTNCKISDIEKKLHLRFPIESEVQISQPGPGCSLRIPDVLRRPAMFRWYEFDKARFCSDYWDAATKTPFAMTGKESFMSWVGRRTREPTRLRSQLPGLCQPAGVRRQMLRRPAPPRSRPRSGSNGEMTRRLVIEP